MRKLSLPVRILLAFLSFLLGVALFASVVVTALIADIQIVTSQDTLQSLVQELLSGPAHIRPHTTGIPGEGGLQIAPRVHRYQRVYRSEAEDVADDLTKQLIELFYDQVSEQLGEEFPVSKEEFTQMIQDSTVKDYISEKTAGLLTDYFNDTVTTTFEPEEIVQLIEENSRLIESITGQPIPEDIADQVGQVFDENEIIQKVEAEGLAGFINDENLDIPILNQLSGGDGFPGIRSIVNSVRDFASRENLILGIVISVVLIAAILLVNAMQLPKGFRRAGYPLMFAGIPVIVNLLALFVPDMWNALPGMDVAQKIFQQTAIVNIIVFGTGFVLCLTGIILGIVLRVRRKIIENREDEDDRSDEPVEVAAQVFDVDTAAIIPNNEPPADPVVEVAAPVAEAAVAEAPAEEPASAGETPAEESVADAPASTEETPAAPAEETVTAE